MALPNLAALAEKNTALLEAIGFDPRYDDPFALDDPQVFAQTGLFPPEALPHIFAETPAPPLVLPTNRVYAPRIGMLLVRPDMIHINQRAEHFIKERFTLLESADITVTPEQYWSIYNDAIVKRETKQSRLTRAAVYINSPCRLIIFRSDTVSTQPTADHVFQELKGRQGQPRPNTLRGELVFQGAVEAGLHTLEDLATARAADPFGAYRKIVREHPHGPHNDLVFPLLFFTGVGVHVPNYAEMQRDLDLFRDLASDYLYDAA